MTAQLITLTHGDTMISSPDSGLILQVLTGLVGVAPTNTQAADFIPALGEYWPGQGGVNGGPRPAHEGVPAHYLILATEDGGEHKWGGYGTESGAVSRWDGMRNTEQLLSEGDHPAANAAAKYTADGHHDFFLGSPADMHQVWVNGLITKDAYWTSAQRSAYNAFHLGFGVGTQLSFGKNHELRVRPVRRFIR